MNLEEWWGKSQCPHTDQSKSVGVAPGKAMSNSQVVGLVSGASTGGDLEAACFHLGSGGGKSPPEDF